MMQINLIEDSSTQYFIKKIQNDLFLAISKNKFFRYEEIVPNNDVFVYEIHFVLFVYVNNVVFRRLYQFVATFIHYNFYYDFKHCPSRSNYEWVSFIVYRMIESFPNTNIQVEAPFSKVHLQLINKLSFDIVFKYQICVLHIINLEVVLHSSSVTVSERYWWSIYKAENDTF
jgi:hypothetical protein